RHTLGLQHGDHFVDLADVKLDPALLAKLVDAVRRTGALLRRRSVGVVGLVLGQFTVGCLVVLRRGVGRIVLALWLRVRFTVRLVAGVPVVLLVGRLVGLFRGRLADGGAIVQAQHHHNDIGLFAGDDVARGSGPIGRRALGLVLDQAGVAFH